VEIVMNELVKKLSEGSHPVELALRPDKSCQVLTQCLERGYLHIKFTGTSGGTELGVTIDHDTIQKALTDINDGKSTIHVSGTLTLDYVPVRCLAEIDLNTYGGTGHLEGLQ